MRFRARYSSKFVIAACIAALAPSTTAAFDLQGHRGARGLAPENTLPSFTKALQLGVSTLELDTAVTADGVVIVRHDVRLDPNIARGADGKWIERGGPTIFSMKSADLVTYDVGRINPASKYAKRFPEQQPVDGTPIPKLSDVIALVREAKNETVRFNIETKLSPDLPNDTPTPTAFVDALLAVIVGENIADRTTIQSFDWRTLVAARKKAPDIDTACLTVEQNWLDNIQRGKKGASRWTAGFDIDDEPSLPHLVWRAGCRVWSPFHLDVSLQSVSLARTLGLKVIPWTVNEPDRMGQLIDMGVDGIITDYPDRLRAVMAERTLPLPAPSEIKSKKKEPTN